MISANSNSTNDIKKRLRHLFLINHQPKFKFVKIEPTKQTEEHCHHELEMWFIIAGEGIVKRNNDTFKVKDGDVVYLDPLTTHSIKNISIDENLTFITIWWTDYKLLEKKINVSRIIDSSNSRNKNILVVPSFPTPNGNLHVGHLAGPYIASDIYKRYQKMMGRKAYCLLGTIGYQTQVAVKGKKLGLSFHQTTQKYSKNILKTLYMAKIYPDVFVRPTEAQHYNEVVKNIFLKLYKFGNIVIKEKNSLFCNHCNKFLFEAHVIGSCPYCSSTQASSNECETCAFIHDDDKLINPTCNDCGNLATLCPLKRAYFPLEPFRSKLIDYYKKIQMSPQLYKFIDKLLSRELPDIPVSHIADTGIPLPIDNFSNQSVYSLFELAGRYITALESLANKGIVKLDWQKISETYSTKLFFGFDNAFLRAVIFPAVLMSFDSKIQLPDLLVSNEFYNLYGSKFSTSRSHAIWGVDLLKNYSSDIVRFYLASTRPEDIQTNFTLKEIDNFIKNTLIYQLEGWFSLIDDKIKQRIENKAPEPKTWSKEAKSYYLEINNIARTTSHFYQDNTFSTRRMCAELEKLIEASKYFSEMTRDDYKFHLNHDKAATNLALELMAARSFAILSYPIMPDFSKKLWVALGYKMTIKKASFKNLIDWVPTNQKISGINQYHFSKSLGVIK
jgi:methionyl-tRNA synthetase